MVRTAAKNKKIPTNKKTFRIPKNSAIRPPTNGPVKVPATTPVDKVPRAYPDGLDSQSKLSHWVRNL